MSELWANLAVAVGILLTGVAALLMVVGMITYFRLRHARLAWISLAFLGFVVMGILFTVEAYQDRGTQSLPVLPALGLAIVLALYLAVLKR